MANVSGFYVILSIVLSTLLQDVSGQCQPGAEITDPKDAFPDIFNITHSSYQMTIEANMAEVSKTLYATEYYDNIFGRGRVDTLYAGEEKHFLYLKETGETFTSFEYTCKAKALYADDLVAPHDEYGVYGWTNTKDRNRPMAGPSNLLRDAFNNKKTSLDKQVPNTVRGIQTKVWKECREDGKVGINYFFIDKDTESGFAKEGLAVPARITVERYTPDGDKKAFKHTYDFVNYQSFAQHQEEVFAIPTRVGCERLNEDTKTLPVFDNHDFHVEAEVVYTPPIGVDHHSYVSNLAVTVDHKSSHLAYTFTPWKFHSDAKFAEPGDFEEIVYDYNNGIMYDLDRATENCAVTKTIEGAFPSIRFPDGKNVSLMDDNLFILKNETAKKFHYLGDGVERGIPVSIFERKSEDGAIIITRYHLAGDTYLNSEYTEKDAPIKVVYWNLKDSNPNDFFGVVVINFYAFSSRFQDKAKKFDVTPCFANDDQSKWFQVTFPMGQNDARDVIPFIPFIKDNILSILERGEPGIISPLRIPNVMVDVDADNIYVTALILERPDYLMDFESNGPYGIKSEVNTVRRLTTKAGCAKACLEDGITGCKFFSYCGAICKKAESDPISAKDYVQSPACEMFSHVSPGTLRTMNQITADIAKAVNQGSVSIELLPTEKGAKVMTFTATDFKDGLAYGLEGLTNKPEDSIEERFDIFKTGFTFDVTQSDINKPFGSQSFATCRRLCLNSATCESISFCLANSQCSISSAHSDEIKPEHIKEDGQCMILSRTYLDYYEKFPGFSVVQKYRKAVKATSSETCAKACKAQTDFKCLSFDFCFFGEETCLLHSEHFIDTTETSTLKTEQQCSHYSSKLVYDFKQTRGNTLTGSVENGVAAIDVEQCAKYCVERSKSKTPCKAFDFCQDYEKGTSICHMTTEDAPARGMTTKASCDVYEADKGTTQRSPDLSPRTYYSSGHKRGEVRGSRRPQQVHRRRR